jgi:hypothetical protein
MIDISNAFTTNEAEHGIPDFYAFFDQAAAGEHSTKT